MDMDFDATQIMLLIWVNLKEGDTVSVSLYHSLIASGN